MSDAERELERDDEHQVTPLELFFDLVFVFAITQVTSGSRYAPTATLHLPMIAGIVLFVLGLEKTAGHAGETLDTVPALALCGDAA